ncbi:MAG: NAD-dependent epimerase/dehydratase family protein [Anaerolineae bacterium]
MDLAGRTALVTGAAGFIGGWLVERLVTDTGVCVRGLVQPSQQADWLKGLGVQIIEGDITDADAMREVTEGCDVVFHLAAWLDEPPSAKVAWTTNVTGTETMLGAAVNVMRFVYVSSIMVYGAVVAGMVDEDYPYGTWHPKLEPYGATKIEAERRVFRAFRQRGLPITVIRPSNVYGPRAGSWVARALRRMRDNRPTLIGGGRGFVHPIYVENLVDGIVLAAQHEQGIGEAFNLSDGSAMTWHDFYRRYGQLIDCRPRSIPTAIAYVLASVREIRGRLTGLVPSLTRTLVRQVIGQPVYSIEKARQLLGYKPRVDFEEAMHRTEIWYRNARARRCGATSDQ